MKSTAISYLTKSRAARFPGCILVLTILMGTLGGLVHAQAPTDQFLRLIFENNVSAIHKAFGVSRAGKALEIYSESSGGRHRVRRFENGEYLSVSPIIPLFGPELKVLDDGSFYVLGETNVTVAADGLEWSLAGRFVAKYNAAARLLWATNQPDQTGGDRSFKGATLPDGGIVTAGALQTSVALTRLDAEGGLLWSRRLTNLTQCSVAADPQGRITVAGIFTGKFSAGSTTIESRGGTDVAVVQLAADGAVTWVRQAGGPLAETGIAVAVGGLGEVMVTGTFTRRMLADGLEAVSRGGAGRDVFLVRYDNTGGVQWLKAFGDVGDDEVYDLSSDDDGNAYLTYRIFGEDKGSSPPNASSLLAKLDTTGSLIWNNRVSFYLDDASDKAWFVLLATGVDRSGNLYTIGKNTEASFGSVAIVSPSLATSSGSTIYFIDAGENRLFHFRTTNPERMEDTPTSIDTYAGLTLSGRVGRTYRIEFQPILKQEAPWQSLTNVVLTSAPHLWIDKDSHDRGQGYYRAVLLP